MAEGTILQIIPAAGWRALYFDVEASVKSKDPIIHVQYLVCWALLDGIGGVAREVVGLISVDGDLYQAPSGCEPMPITKKIIEMDQPPNIFLGYSAPEEILSEAMKRAKDLMFEQMKELGLT